jgi:hypothetical protein
MDDLTKQLCKLERDVAKYIYIKYLQLPIDKPKLESKNKQIVNKDNSSSDEEDETREETKEETRDETREETRDETREETREETRDDTKRCNKILDNDKYKMYIKNVFTQSRSCAVINQNDIIKDDLQTMEIANKAYESNPKAFKISNFGIPPDVLRCSFIRKHHHRYYRCKKRISSNDSDVCKKHEECENIYYDKYNELLEQFT